VLAVTAPGSLDPCGRGIRKIQKVRLLHAAIRYLISGSGRWDAEADGVPSFEGAAPALTRYLLGEEVCAIVGLPRGR